MRRSFFVAFLLFFGVGTIAGQRPFVGKITYHSGDSGYLAFSAHYYFSPKKIRIDFNFPKFPDEDQQHTPSQILDIDSNIVFIIDPGRKLVQKVIIDTIIATGSATRKKLPGYREINGYRCYAIETTDLQQLKTGDTTETYSFRQVSWFAEDLVCPIQTTFPQVLDGIFNNHNICLLTEAVMIMRTDTSSQEIEWLAKKIEPYKIDDSLFTLPANYDLVVLKATDLVKKGSYDSVQLTDVKVEMEHFDPPPPPPPPGKEKKPGQTNRKDDTP